MKNTTARFRCIRNTKPNAGFFTPEFDFDVVEMRKHPDYVEVDADGNDIVPDPALSVEATSAPEATTLVIAPAVAPKRGPGRPRKNG